MDAKWILIFGDALDPSHLVVADGPAAALRLSVLLEKCMKRPLQ